MSSYMQYVTSVASCAFIFFQVIPKLFGFAQEPNKNKCKQSGFNVKYELKDAGVKGKGIFTCEDIKCGTKVWGLVEGNHFVYRNENELRQRLKGLTNEEAKHVLNHIWGMEDNETILECNDDAEYVNHSSDSNLVCGFQLSPPNDDNSSCWAGRDIFAGEELTDNYSLYGTPTWYINICSEYGVESSKDVCEKY